MLSSKTLLLACTTAMLTCTPQCALADVHQVDSQTNAVDLPLSQTGMRVRLIPGQYTVTLQASDFRLNAGNPAPQPHVMAHCVEEAGLTDYRVFTLNGVGDAKTLNWPGGEMRLFFLDEDVLEDNTGSSSVRITGTGGFDQTYRVDALTNVVGASLTETAVRIPLQPGRYAITLQASDFRLNGGTPAPQSHITAHCVGEAGLMEYRVFSLNGFGASRTLDWPGGELRLFFIDETVLADNTGGSIVEVKRILPPLTMQIASVALRWETATNETYQLQFSAEMQPGTWVNLGDTIPGTGAMVTVIDEVFDHPRRFYRLQLVQ
jgi:hypothetical protein